MLYGLYLSAAGLQAQEYRQSVTANNLANAQTTGFKRDLAIVQARRNAVHEDPVMAPYRVPVLDRQGGGVFAAPTAIEMTQGPLERTVNETDVALEGDGFFVVQGDAGTPMLTRDGRFLKSSDNTLVRAATGKPVLDAEMQPIHLDATTPVEIDSHGTIRQGQAIVAQLAVMTAPAAGLVKAGGNLLTTKPGVQLTPATVDTKVRQHHLEASGVDPMTEIVSMMECQRAFEANAKMIQYQDQTLAQLNTIGRIA